MKRLFRFIRADCRERSRLHSFLICRVVFSIVAMWFPCLHPVKSQAGASATSFLLCA